MCCSSKDHAIYRKDFAALAGDAGHGMPVKVAYEVKDGRNVARVIEATKP